jgi:hypothetical protein
MRPTALDPAAEQIMVPMRDGVCLATDVYLPSRPGRLPAVLVRLPYDKCARYTFMPQCAPYFTERGYAFVVQDVRGKFRSEGETMPFVHEVYDGYDTLEWLAGQSWSNGRVGMFGDSYYGYTQWAAVASGHPALKAIVPRVTSSDLKVLSSWWGDSVVQLYGADYLAHYWADPLIYFFEVDWTQRPLAEAFDEGFAAIGTRSAGLDAMIHLAGPGGIAEYPSGHPFDRLSIPALHSVGWFDNIAPSSFEDYVTLRGRAGLADLQYLVADATDHENYHLRQVPVSPQDDHDINDEALGRMLPVYLGPGLAFFDAFLKGEGDGSAIPAAEWYLANEEWHRSATWPPPGAHALDLFLDSAERASAGVEGGVLSQSAPSAAGVARWVHDPANLVPSTVLNPFAFLFEWPDEREVERRDDVLTFTSEPVAESLDLVGPVAVSLTVGSSGPSMHVFAKLCDVEPDGTAHMLVRGEELVRGSDFGGPITISMSHTGYRLLPGHSLRLHIASSDFPLYLWHPGTDEDPWLATKGEANQQTIAVGGEKPSRMTLSVLG